MCQSLMDGRRELFERLGVLRARERANTESRRVRSDPSETDRLTELNSPDHPMASIRIGAAMDPWTPQSGDLGRIAERPEVVEFFVEEMDDWFGTHGLADRSTNSTMLS